MTGVAVSFRNGLQSAASIAVDVKYGMNRYVRGQILASDGRRNRIHEKRHIVVDHVDDRVSRRVAMLFLGRIVNAQQGLAFLARRAELKVIKCNSRHDPFGSALKIFNGHMGEIVAQVGFDICPFLQDFALNAGG